mgnify:CR=1 FL=1
MAKYIKYDRLEDAVNLLKEMKDEYNIKPNTPVYNTLIRGYSHKGDWKTCFKLFNQLKKTGLHPSVETFVSLFHCLSKTKPTNVTREGFENIQNQVKKYNIPPNLPLQNSILKVFNFISSPFYFIN